MASNNRRIIIYNIKNWCNRLILVVGDALWIVALNDATNLIRCHYVALLNHLVVPDDAKPYVGADNSQSADFVVREHPVGYFDHSFLPDFVAAEVVSDEHGLGECVELE